MIGLQTTFSIINTILPDLSNERLVDLLSFSARAIFKLPNVGIKEGSVADITLYQSKVPFELKKENIKSKSVNTPFISVPLKGRVIGIINKEKVYLNE
jgi:dihydroorotase